MKLNRQFFTYIHITLVRRIFLTFRPKSSMSIAVGSVNGILVWFTDGTSASMRYDRRG